MNQENRSARKGTADAIKYRHRLRETEQKLENAQQQIIGLSLPPGLTLEGWKLIHRDPSPFLNTDGTVNRSAVTTTAIAALQLISPPKTR